MPPTVRMPGNVPALLQDSAANGHRRMWAAPGTGGMSGPALPPAAPLGRDAGHVVCRPAARSAPPPACLDIGGEAAFSGQQTQARPRHCMALHRPGWEQTNAGEQHARSPWPCTAIPVLPAHHLRRHLAHSPRHRRGAAGGQPLCPACLCRCRRWRGAAAFAGQALWRTVRRRADRAGLSRPEDLRRYGAQGGPGGHPAGLSGAEGRARLFAEGVRRPVFHRAVRDRHHAARRAVAARAHQLAVAGAHAHHRHGAGQQLADSAAQALRGAGRALPRGLLLGYVFHDARAAGVRA